MPAMAICNICAANESIKIIDMEKVENDRSVLKDLT